MDDEDFSEYGIAPKQVQTKKEFVSKIELGFAGLRGDLQSSSANDADSTTTLNDVLKDVITLKSVSIGIQILKRMKKNAIKKIIKR